MFGRLDSQPGAYFADAFVVEEEVFDAALVA